MFFPYCFCHICGEIKLHNQETKTESELTTEARFDYNRAKANENTKQLTLSSFSNIYQHST